MPGPTTSVTAAPRSNASAATANPILPVERFPTKRTGSIGSHVGPAVTTMRLPARSPAEESTSSIACTMPSGSVMRPVPSSPAASEPWAGPTMRAPREESVFTLACVAACSHIPVCIAGARTSGQVASSNVDVSRSSAMPCASLAITFAVAGATTAMSASWASRTCRTTPGSSNRSV